MPLWLQQQQEELVEHLDKYPSEYNLGDFANEENYQEPDSLFQAGPSSSGH